jgi:hypothetical protein
MQCILYKVYFWKVFHMYYKLICILYALLCGQNFILVKSGCYTSLAPARWAGRSRLEAQPERVKWPWWLACWGAVTVTPSFKAKTRCSSYVCSGSSCHTHGQSVNIENQCLKYVNFVTWILFLHRRL